MGDNDLLKGVWQYLWDRNVPLDGWIYGKKFIRATRKKHTTCITVDGFWVKLETVPIDPKGHFIQEIKFFDLNDPNSLQAVFEHVMSKRRK